VFAAPCGASQALTILHSNDLHAHLMPDDRDNGGFARLATEVRRQKAQCAACLYLNAGDLVQGTPVSTLFHGAPIYEIANLLGLDASTSAITTSITDGGAPRNSCVSHISRSCRRISWIKTARP